MFFFFVVFFFLFFQGPLKYIEYKVYGDLAIIYPEPFHLLKGDYNLQWPISSSLAWIGFKVKALGFGLLGFSGLGFRVWGLEFRV